MSNELPRVEIACALCGPGIPFRVRFPEHLQTELNFAARKLPTRQHFRIVECKRCGLIYSNPIVPFEKIYQLYKDSSFIQEAQMENMLFDYRAEVQNLLPRLRQRDALLEIGCSNGFFLQAARTMGFASVHGIEPGEEAVRRADPSIRPSIINGIFTPDLFAPESFDLACCFQVLDHLLDPNAVLHGLHRLLRPGGLVLLLNHNIRSWLPRALSERSPMYDVEHIYLFDPRTVKRLLHKHHFEVVDVHNVSNSYTLDYALKMFPLPLPIKNLCLGAVKRIGLSGWRLRLPAGNMVAVGRKAIRA